MRGEEAEPEREQTAGEIWLSGQDSERRSIRTKCTDVRKM